jgi:ceramide glucosyltransferase
LIAARGPGYAPAETMGTASVLPLLSAATLMSILYLSVALACIRAFARRQPDAPGWCPPVTVLKPLCGLEPLLEDNLRSFCRQEYPEYEVVFGVQAADDPAVGVVERLAGEGHRCRLELVVDTRLSGPNAKVSNLANMHEHAKHDVVVVSDSDMRVDPGWLARAVGPLADPSVGLVTCLYRGRALVGPPSVLGAMYVNEWFVPAVLVAARFGRGPFGFGSTLALRRETLEAVGGFRALTEYVADDYMLAALVARRGQRIVLSGTVVELIVSEPGLAGVFAHELRWARVVRSVRPLGWALSLLTHALPLAGAHWIASGFSPVATVLLGIALGLRIAVHEVMPRCLGLPRQGARWLVPVREAMSVVVWALSFLGSTVEWRGRRLSVRRAGRAGAAGRPPSC